MKLQPFALERFFAQHEFTAPYLLCVSDCETITLRELLALDPPFEQRLFDLRLNYAESPGSHELREAIAGLYRDIRPGQALAHTGAQEAIFNFMRSCLEPGDHIIVHTPCYQSFTEVPRGLGCEVTSWPGRPADGWAPSLEALERAITPRTRAIAINSPHNPTGWLMDGAYQARLVSIARKHGLWIFSDEVYRLLEHDPATRPEAMCDAYERGISLGVTSKSYGLAGLRIGWAASRDADVIRRMEAGKDYLSLCNNSIGELLTVLALRNRDAIVERNLGLALANLALLDAFMARFNDRIEWVRPRAGCLAFPRWKGSEPIDSVAARLLASHGVLIAPGKLFETEASHFRVGFGRFGFAEGLTRFQNFLNQES